MSTVFRCRGRELSAEDIGFIRSLIAAHPTDSRRALSRRLCQAWNWRQPNGQLRDMVCRSLMLELKRAGYITLPPVRGRPANPLARRARPAVVEIDQSPIRCRLGELGALEFLQVRRRPEERLFNSLIEQHHYLGYTQPVGEQLKYLICAQQRPVARVPKILAGHGKERSRDGQGEKRWGRKRGGDSSRRGQIFTAPAPRGVGSEKYDASVASMTGLLKYGSGVPFYRLAKLQHSLGIPLPASTQWDLVRRGAVVLEPVHEELIRQAAQGDVLHNDDTTARVLASIRARGPDPVSDGKSRKGTYTTGIVSRLGQSGRRVGLFFTGHQHAGENLEKVLAERAAELSAPLHMCDGLSHNTAGEFDTIAGNCLAHARRYYVSPPYSRPLLLRRPIARHLGRFSLLPRSP